MLQLELANTERWYLNLFNGWKMDSGWWMADGHPSMMWWAVGGCGSIKYVARNLLLTEGCCGNKLFWLAGPMRTSTTFIFRKIKNPKSYFSNFPDSKPDSKIRFTPINPTNRILVFDRVQCLGVSLKLFQRRRGRRWRRWDKSGWMGAWRGTLVRESKA